MLGTALGHSGDKLEGETLSLLVSAAYNFDCPTRLSLGQIQETKFRDVASWTK
jgi:hypothetical protein